MKFGLGTYIRHQRTGGTYIITNTPDVVIMMPPGQEPCPGYEYRRVKLFREVVNEVTLKRRFVRSQVEVEDGRFKKVDVAYADLYGQEYPL